MFNAQNSAYGRGITANLVSEEQRVKYNTGGRVGFLTGSEVNPNAWLKSIGKTAGTAGTAGAAGYGASKIRLPALYKPGWWQRIKNLGGRGRGLMSALKPAGGVTGAGFATSLPLVAAAASPFIAQSAATSAREKG